MSMYRMCEICPSLPGGFLTLPNWCVGSLQLHSVTPDTFVSKHAREEARIARWKRMHKKEVTIPNGFRLNPTPPNDYTKYVHPNHNVLNGGSSALNAEVNEEGRGVQRHPSAPRADATHNRPFSARPSVALLKRPGTANPAPASTSHANGASRFVSKVLEAREAGAARAESPTAAMEEYAAGATASSRVGPPAAGVLYPAAFKVPLSPVGACLLTLDSCSTKGFPAQSMTLSWRRRMAMGTRLLKSMEVPKSTMFPTQLSNRRFQLSRKKM
eukprot:752328-Hanusia_phi.AAC.1